MAKFTAADAGDPLEYDFRPHDDATGTVPEPTDDQVAEFYAALGRGLEDALGEERVAEVDLTSPYGVASLLGSLTADEHRAMYDYLLTTHADVCSGSPSREQIAALPFRLRRAFYGAVQEWLRPESSRTATDD